MLPALRSRAVCGGAGEGSSSPNGDLIANERRRQRQPGGLDFLLFFAYAGFVPNTQTCRVSFTDGEGIMHAVQVPAASLFEAAALAVAEFRRCGFMNDAALGPATRLTVTVKAPVSVHELPLGKLMSWLESGVKSPREEVLRNRLREVLAHRQ
jgi:hypothetical protein